MKWVSFICLVYGKKQSERSRFTFLLPTTMAGGGGAAPASEAIARRRALQGKSGWVSSSLVDWIIMLMKGIPRRLALCITDESLPLQYSLLLVDCT